MDALANVTGDQLRGFIIVVAAIVVFMNGIFGLIKNIREVKKPVSDINDWRKTTDAKLASDKKRLDDLENGNAALCRGILALLNHEITGNSVDKLKIAQQELTDYLIERR